MEPEIDRELWIEAEGFEGRSYLVGNSHTFPGRMLLWNEQQDVVASVSKSEITSASDASRRWIDGFLVGNEPGLADYLGIDPATAADLRDDDPAVRDWLRARVQFDETGAIRMPFDAP